MLRTDDTGFSVKCTVHIPADTSVVTCPFDLAITLESVQDALQFYCKFSPGASLSERQRICTYISLHWIVADDDTRYVNRVPAYYEAITDGTLLRLRHRPYLNILPKPEKLVTPLYFSDEELDLFSGTNLHHATVSQRSTWKEEWANLRSILRDLKSDLSEKLTWLVYPPFFFQIVASYYLST